MDVWKKFKFSVDLINGALNEIHFLKEINDSPLAFNEKLVDRAVYRYEKIWLPFYAHNASSAELSPPLDIEWVGFIYILSNYYLIVFICIIISILIGVALSYVVSLGI